MGNSIVADLGVQRFHLFLQFQIFFFLAQAVEEALRKDRDCGVEKETPKRKGASGLKYFQNNFQKNHRTRTGWLGTPRPMRCEKRGENNRIKNTLTKTRDSGANLLLKIDHF